MQNLMTPSFPYYIACKKCETKTKLFADENEAVGAWNKAMGNRDCLSRDHCKDCGKYDREHHYCPEFCDVIRDTINDLKEHWPERTAVVEKGGAPDVMDLCGYCKGGIESRNYRYCPYCGCRLEWEE